MTQPPVPDAINYQRCNIPFYRAGSSPAYLCAKLRDHAGPHSGDIIAFPFRCHVCSNAAPYRCLGCESNYCRVHMAEHVLGTQERELELRLQTIETATQTAMRPDSSCPCTRCKMIREVVPSDHRDDSQFEN